MTWVNWKKKKNKKKAGIDTQIDMSRTAERSWIQKRTSELILEEFPDGNSFVASDWSRCYKLAVKEWSEQSNEGID